MLQTRGLSRAFGGRTVVDSVDLDVQPGRVTGFVGSNGAGKTTTMRMILGVLAPTSGEVLWEGEPITVAQRRRIGYMPEERGLYPRMPVIDQLVFLARLYGASPRQGRQRAMELLEHFGLVDRRSDLLDSLSLGNQQRVQIAASVIHRPDALVLDEPFSGLDPLAVDQMVDLLKREAGDKPLLFSSHQLDLVERLCDDLVILSAGRVVASGSVADLKAGGPQRYRVVLDGTEAKVLRSLRSIKVLELDGQSAVIDLKGAAPVPSKVLASISKKGKVAEFARINQPLSDIYREVTS